MAYDIQVKTSSDIIAEVSREAIPNSLTRTAESTSSVGHQHQVDC